MKRITTFKMFESMQDLKPMVEFLPKLNQKTEPLGFKFHPSHNSIASAYSKGEEMKNQGKECPLRDLIIKVFYSQFAGKSYRLHFMRTNEEGAFKENINFDAVFSYAYDGKTFHNMHNTASLGVNLSDSQNIKRVTDRISDVLSSCERTMVGPPTWAPPLELPIDPIVPSFVPGFIAEILGDHEAPKLLAGAIQGAQPMVTQVVLAFKEGAPELWQRIKPWLGEGGGEVEDMADLGF